jgi:hypothetical protein
MMSLLAQAADDDCDDNAADTAAYSTNIVYVSYLHYATYMVDGTCTKPGSSIGDQCKETTLPYYISTFFFFKNSMTLSTYKDVSTESCEESGGASD